MFLGHFGFIFKTKQQNKTKTTTYPSVCFPVVSPTGGFTFILSVLTVQALCLFQAMPPVLFIFVPDCSSNLKTFVVPHEFQFFFSVCGYVGTMSLDL